jgi:hypothetical protein
MSIRHTVLMAATALLTLLLPLGVAAQQNQLLPMEGQGGWGYVDLTGAWVIQPQFQQATRFSEGRALVLDGGSWHFIDETGQNATGHRFDWGGSSSSKGIELSAPGASLFSDGLAAVYIPLGGPAFIRPSGEIAFEIDGSLPVGFPYSFRDGLAVAHSDRGKAGYVDETGAWTIPATFRGANAFSEGLGGAQDDETGLWGYIDRSGSWVIEPQFSYAGLFSNGLAPVIHERPDWAGYIDPSGALVIADDFHEIAPFNSGLARVKVGESSYFIDTEGMRAFDEESLAPFCYTESFQDGLALVVMETADGCDYVSSFTDGMVFVHHLRGRLGYIDTSGSVVVRQPQADRDAIIAERDAEVAERQRAEQEELDAETMRLAACPEFAGYGEAGSGNYMVVRVGGKERVLHFQATAIHRRDDGSVRVVLPSFGRDDTHSSAMTRLSYHLHEREDRPGGHLLQTYVLGATAPRLDCVSIPEGILRQRGATVQLSAFTLPGPGRLGHAAGSITNPTRSAGEDGIEFHFDTTGFFGLDSTELTSGSHDGEPLDQAEIVFRPTDRRLSIQIPTGDGASTYDLGSFDGEPGVYYRDGGSQLLVYDVSRLGEDAAIDVFRFDIADFDEEQKSSFFSWGRDQRLRDLYAPDPADRVLSLVASSYVREPYLPTLAFTPVGSAGPAPQTVDDRDPEVRLAHALFASMFSGARQTLLTIDDLPLRVNEGLPPPRAHEWRLRPTGMPLIVHETSGPAGGDTWQISVEAKVAEKEEEAQETTDATIALCHDFLAGMKRLEAEAADEEVLMAGAISLMIAAGIEGDRGASGEIDPEAMFEAFDERCMPVFGRGGTEPSLEAIYNEMLDEMSPDRHKEAAADMGLQLKVDAATGAPLQRSFSSKDTRIEVEYRPGHVLVTAENDAQGRHQAQFAVPAGILDIAQLHAVLAALPLEQGYANEIFFLATVPGTLRTTELVADGSTRSSTSRTVDLRFVRVVVMVDRLAPATEALGEEAYVVKLGVEPDSYGTWPLGINPPVIEEGISYVLYHIGRESRALLTIEHADGITVRRIQ